MLCKYCKQNTIVTDGVDNRDSDETYRLRVCPRCGRTFYTVEFPVEVDERFMNDWAKYHKQHKHVIGNTYVAPDGVRKLCKDYVNRKYGLKGVKNKEKRK